MVSNDCIWVSKVFIGLSPGNTKLKEIIGFQSISTFTLTAQKVWRQNWPFEKFAFVLLFYNISS